MPAQAPKPARAPEPTQEVEPAHEALLRLVRDTHRGKPATEPVLVICRWCGATEFTVGDTECFCIGCCLPLGVGNGEEHGFPGQYPWRLEAGDTPIPACAAQRCCCHDGHAEFELALATTPGPDHRPRTLTIALHCPQDHSLHLYLSNAHLTPR
ncbi:hypothetical protein [Streptomyces sp. NPDC089919]|uniref:hypothetical protein n=1 Tax=Streptomyces sp. NPDC089919 TaxID=3155188 RepID=UPI003424DA84